VAELEENILNQISNIIQQKTEEMSVNLRQASSQNSEKINEIVGSLSSVIEEIKQLNINSLVNTTQNLNNNLTGVIGEVSQNNNNIKSLIEQQRQIQSSMSELKSDINSIKNNSIQSLNRIDNQTSTILSGLESLKLTKERKTREDSVEDATGQMSQEKEKKPNSSLQKIKKYAKKIKKYADPIKKYANPIGAGVGLAAQGAKSGYDYLNGGPSDTSGDRRTGGQTGGQTDQGPSLPPTGMTPSSGEYSGNLAKDRKVAFEKELENPAVLRRLYNLSRSEVGKNPINQQLFSETVFNRSMLRDRSLSSTMSSVRSEGVRGGYFPVIKNYNPSPEELERFKQSVINKTMSGANNTKMATDNASLDVARRRMQAGAHGQYLGVGKKDISKEYYYRGGEDAGKYKTRHGMRAEEYQKKLEQESRSQSSSPSAPQRQETSGVEMPDNVSFSSPSVESRASGLNSETQDALKKFKQVAPPGAVVTSTYRSPRHRKESRKRRPGAHTRGQAIDIRTRGVSKEDLQKTIQGLKASGFNYILLEGKPPHIHAERRPGQPFKIKNLRGGNPHISLDDARAAAEQVPINAAERQADDKSTSEAEIRNQLEAAKKEVETEAKADQKAKTSNNILPSLFGFIPPANADDKKRISKKEDARRYYQESLEQFKSDVGLGTNSGDDDDTGPEYDPESSELPKYLRNLYKATRMDSRGKYAREDVEGGYFPNIEKKRDFTFETKESDSWFRRQFGGKSAEQKENEMINKASKFFDLTDMGGGNGNIDEDGNIIQAIGKLIEAVEKTNSNPPPTNPQVTTASKYDAQIDPKDHNGDTGPPDPPGTTSASPANGVSQGPNQSKPNESAVFGDMYT
tara:strand:- start:1710 stop:4280 length:2571 start_codon:yes stop_codon:yes gene_type:complete